MNFGNNIGEKMFTEEQKEKFGLYDSIQEVYDFISSNPDDQKGKNSMQWIAHYMPTLNEYAQKCDSVVEIGVNQVCSTWAFLLARPKDGVLSIDIDLQRTNYMSNRLGLSENIWLSWAKHLSEKEEVAFSAVESDSREVTLPEHDLLFIDSEHTFEQLDAELKLHGKKAQKYIILHDTTLFPELDRAVDNFLDMNKNFQVEKVFTDTPGLTILRNTDNE